jgi:hypothetical protein
MHALHATEEFTRREDWDDAPSDPPDGVGGLRRFRGKYPGVVVNPIDPEMRCRIQVMVPDVFGPNMTSWALPCLPFAGLSMGMYVVPPIGANVWIEFLHGNMDVPIWTGFWFGGFETTPKTALLTPPGPPTLVVDSLVQHSIVISDVPVLPYLPTGGVLLKSGVAYVAVDATGVRIFGASVQMNGAPDGLNIAAAGLMVT